VRDGNDRPVVVTEEDRLAVLLQETDRTAAIEEEL
jgi:hypothetical protein